MIRTTLSQHQAIRPRLSLVSSPPVTFKIRSGVRLLRPQELAVWQPLRRSTIWQAWISLFRPNVALSKKIGNGLALDTWEAGSFFFGRGREFKYRRLLIDSPRSVFQYCPWLTRLDGKLLSARSLMTQLFQLPASSKRSRQVSGMAVGLRRSAPLRSLQRSHRHSYTRKDFQEWFRRFSCCPPRQL